MNMRNCALVGTLAILLGCVGAKNADPAADAYQAGVRDLESRDFVAAVVAFTEVIRLDPTCAGAYYDRGLAFGNKGERDRAIADFTEAIRLNPRHELAYCNRGKAYNSKGEYDKAIVDFTDTVRLNPEERQGILWRGLRGAKKGEYDMAVADATRPFGSILRTPMRSVVEDSHTRSWANLIRLSLTKARSFGWLRKPRQDTTTVASLTARRADLTRPSPTTAKQCG